MHRPCLTLSPSTFQIHGYVENQTIERSDTYVRDWHNASLRNRLDLQLSGTLAKSLDLPMGRAPQSNTSLTCGPATKRPTTSTEIASATPLPGSAEVVRGIRRFRASQGLTTLARVTCRRLMRSSAPLTIPSSS